MLLIYTVSFAKRNLFFIELFGVESTSPMCWVSYSHWPIPPSDSRSILYAYAMTHTRASHTDRLDSAFHLSPFICERNPSHILLLCAVIFQWAYCLSHQTAFMKRIIYCFIIKAKYNKLKYLRYRTLLLSLKIQENGKN